VLNALRLVNLVFALASAAVGVLFGDFSSPTSALIMIAMILWVLAPFVAFDFIMRRTTSPDWALPVAGLAMAISGLAAVLLYGRTFLFNPAPDAQDPLAFVVLPTYQLGFAGITMLVISLGRTLTR
jgi:hypothetical protein